LKHVEEFNKCIICKQTRILCIKLEIKPRLYHDAWSTNHQDLTISLKVSDEHVIKQIKTMDFFCKLVCSCSGYNTQRMDTNCEYMDPLYTATYSKYHLFTFYLLSVMFMTTVPNTAKFKAPTAMLLKNQVFCVVTSCQHVNSYDCFQKLQCLHKQGQTVQKEWVLFWNFFTLKLKTLRSLLYNPTHALFTL